MDAMQMIMQSRQQDRNPFRDILEKMGAFGGPNLSEVGGVPAGNATQPPSAAPDQGPQMQQLVAALIAKGMPRDQAIQQAKQMMLQRMTGGST